MQTFALCLVSLVALILIGRGLQLSDLFLGLDLAPLDALALFGYLVPFFLLLITPLACMLAVFLTFLRMSTDRELVALKAGGVSLYQLLLSPFLFCLVCMVLNIFISLYGISWGMHNFRDTIVNIASTRARVVIQPGVFNQDLFGLTLFARQVDAASGEMRQVIFEDRTRDANNRITILAPRGSIVTDPATASIIFHLQDGKIYRADKEQFGILGFGEYVIRLDLGNLFSAADLGEQRPKELSWEELNELHFEQSAPNRRYQLKVAVERHKRWALPVACLVLGLFAMPLATAFEGVHRQMGVVLSLVMFLVYYSFLSLGLSMGEAGRLSPVIGLWFPNLIFALAGIYGFRLAVQERSPNLLSLARALPLPEGVRRRLFRKREDA